MAGTVFAVGNPTGLSKINYAQTLIHRSESAVGNVGSGEDDLITWSVPASTLAVAGDRLTFEAPIVFNNTANNKRVRAYLGASSIFDTGTVTHNNVDAYLQIALIRTAATTVIGSAFMVVNGASSVVQRFSITETLANALTLKLTGEAVATNDIVQTSMAVYFVTPRD